MVRPEALRAQKGSELEFDLNRSIPVHVFFDGQFFQLLLVREFALTGVTAIIESLNQERFTDIPLLVTPDGSLLLQGNAEGVANSLSADDPGRRVVPSFGSIYFDGKASLRILGEKSAPPEGWVCVGQALTPADFWERIAEADLPQSGAVDIGLPRIERLAIPAT